jgi:hypothetical protein
MMSCQVVMGTIGPANVDENAALQLQYPSGMIGSFSASLRARAPEDFQVLGHRRPDRRTRLGRAESHDRKLSPAYRSGPLVL